MEVVDIQQPAAACRFPRLGHNGGSPDDEDDNKQLFSKGVSLLEPVGGGGVGVNRLRGWHHSSRIIRVARASGGKDRHSKVWTSKGLRDRRVRLSVGTAIQFYDLQDRLGFEQPSKAVEWLIEAASDAIAELPSLNDSFIDTPCRQLSEETDRGFDSPEVELQNNQRQLLSLASSSTTTSETTTSKGSAGLSLISRSEILVNRAKARDRARERTAKEKEKEQESLDPHSIPNNPSFTELLTGGGSTNNRANSAVEPNLFDKTETAMDYLASSSSSRPGPNQSSAGFSGQIFLGNPHQLQPIMSSIPQFNVAAAENNTQHHHQQDRLQHFSFVPDNLNDYNLNFTISAGLAAGSNNRGTLQSNISPSPLFPYLQRFPHLDGSTNVPFFIGATPPTATAPLHLENHHQLTPALFDGSWQLCYPDQKGKGKNN